MNQSDLRTMTAREARKFLSAFTRKTFEIQDLLGLQIDA